MPRIKIVNGAPVELTASEEAARSVEEQEWEQSGKPAVLRNMAFSQAVRAARNFDQEEQDVLIAAYAEVQLYRVDNTINTPLIDAMQAVFPARSKAQIALTVESRVQAYLVTAATALANKIKDGG